MNSVCAIPVKLLTFIKMSLNETCGKVRLWNHLIYYLLILFWYEKLLHRHCFKPCFRICNKERPVSSSRIQTEWENSSSYYVHENALSGNINTIKKNTVNLLVPIEQPGLEWNTGKCNYIFSFVRRVQKKYNLNGLCIS